jgi:hypothetical protein
MELEHKTLKVKKPQNIWVDVDTNKKIRNVDPGELADLGIGGSQKTKKGSSRFHPY